MCTPLFVVVFIYGTVFQNGDAPIHTALHLNRLGVVKYFIGIGVDGNLKGQVSYIIVAFLYIFPLDVMLCCVYKRERYTEKTKRQYALFVVVFIYGTVFQNGNAPIHTAVLLDRLGVVKYFIGIGAD